MSEAKPAPQIPQLPPAQPVRLAEEIAYVNGAIVSRTLIKSAAGTVTLFALDAGQGLSEHSAPFDAMVTLLDGVAELVIGGKPVIAKTGETVVMPADIPHALNAPERFKMMLVMIRG